MEQEVRKLVNSFFKKYPPLVFREGDFILRSDQNPPGIFYLESGYVKQSTLSAKGEEFIVHLFRPGSFFLMTWAINRPVNSHYFEAVSTVKVRIAPLDEVRKFVKSHPDVLYDFVSRLLAGVFGMVKRFEGIAFDTAYTKTASLLNYLAKTLGTQQKNQIVINKRFTHQEIAAWINSTRETASLQLELLKKKNIISYDRRKIIVWDIKKLEKEITAQAS